MAKVLKPGDTIQIAGLRWEVKEVRGGCVLLQRGAYLCTKTWEQIAAR
jgi:hypothetical protein